MTTQSLKHGGSALARLAATAIVALGASLALPAAHARGDTVGDIVRMQGEQENVLAGLGLVVGLPGTGDSGEELMVARPLFEMLRQMGNPAGTFEDLSETQSVALVLVKCVVPSGGARQGDTIDIRVSTLGSANSLAGGELFLAPLRYEVRTSAGGDLPLAMAQGSIVIDDAASPTNATVPNGARMLQDLRLAPPGATFDLVVERHFAGHGTSVTVSNRINQEWFGTPDLFGPVVAQAIDDRTVRIRVPEEQRGDVPGFLAEILSYPVELRDLGLPSRVIVNRRTGVIIVTGNVQIAPVAITHKDLSITTTLPEPIPTPEAPIARLETWAGVATQPRGAESARLDDLLAAMERLDVPVEDQIDILMSLRKTGHLQAELVIE
ncbi:MAG: flagellar basal body P-ring protein FlgI [Planctomycetota bacterium]